MQSCSQSVVVDVGIVQRGQADKDLVAQELRWNLGGLKISAQTLGSTHQPEAACGYDCGCPWCAVGECVSECVCDCG